jgi:hypothetical protein
MDLRHMADQPGRFIARVAGSMSEVQARTAELQRRLAQQVADLQGSSARSVSR